MYRFTPFIEQNFLKTVRADSELWQYFIFVPDMVYLILVYLIDPWMRFFQKNQNITLDVLLGKFHYIKF